MSEESTSLSTVAWPIFVKELDAFLTSSIIPALPKEHDALIQGLKELGERITIFYKKNAAFMATLVPSLRASVADVMSDTASTIQQRVDETARLTTITREKCASLKTEATQLMAIFRFLPMIGDILDWSVSLLEALKGITPNIDTAYDLQEKACVILHRPCQRALAAISFPASPDLNPTILDKHILEMTVSEQCHELTKHLSWIEHGFVQGVAFALQYLRRAAKCSIKTSYSS